MQMLKMYDNSVLSALAKYYLVFSFFTVYGYIAGATNITIVNGTTWVEMKMYIVGDKAELKCPVTVQLVDDRLAVRWVTPRYSLIDQSSVGDETGIFRGDDRLVLMRNGSLRISPACCLDVGTYQCIVERMNPDGTRLIISEASVSLLMNTTGGFECDTKEKMASCNMTISGTAEDQVCHNVPLYIGIFISGVIWGVVVVYLAQCLRKRCQNRRHRRIVAKLRKGSVSLSERAGSAKVKAPFEAAKAGKEPQQFDMVTNPLQDERGLQQGCAFDEAPSPPPRVEHNDGLGTSRGISPGRLTVAIHASSLQELNTIGSVSSDTSIGLQTKKQHKYTQNGLGHNPTYGLYERGGISSKTGEDDGANILTALDAELSLDDALAFKSSDYSNTDAQGEEGDGYLHLSDCSDDYQGLDGVLDESGDVPRLEGTTPLQRDYFSMKCSPANSPPMKHRISSSDDYEHLNLFSPKQLSLKGPRAHGVGRFNTSYLRPMANYEHTKIGRGRDEDLPPPPPPPETIVEESFRSQSASRSSLPLPPPPVDAAGEGPFYVFLDNKGYTSLTTSTWPRRVSANKKQYQPIPVTPDTPDYLELIASADCIYNSANDEFYF